MAKYTILPSRDGGFNIAIVGDDGARQTMLGFKTREAAEAWVVEDHRRSSDAIPNDFRMQRRW